MPGINEDIHCPDRGGAMPAPTQDNDRIEELVVRITACVTEAHLGCYMSSFDEEPILAEALKLLAELKYKHLAKS